MHDINLIYSGGSGGFLLLHLLLLSDRYNASLRSNDSLDQIIKNQWTISAPQFWKKTEVWPNNILTRATNTNLAKVYYYCNASLDQSFDYSKFNLVLYTDYNSQRKLAYFKRAHWFLGCTKPVFDYKFSTLLTLLREWQKHYNNIKDVSWPSCISFRHINKLPHYIQTEVLANPYTSYFVNYVYSAPYSDYQNENVYSPVLPFLQSASVVIKLQDLVNSDGQILVDKNLLTNINQQQIQLLCRWKKLHTLDLLKDIGIL